MIWVHVRRQEVMRSATRYERVRDFVRLHRPRTNREHLNSGRMRHDSSTDYTFTRVFFLVVC